MSHVEQKRRQNTDKSEQDHFLKIREILESKRQLFQDHLAQIADKQFPVQVVYNLQITEMQLRPSVP